MHLPFETPEGPRTIAVDGRFRTNTMLAIRDAAIAGHGIAMLPGWVVATELRNGSLVQVLPEFKLPRVEVHGLFHHGARGSRTIKLVLDYFAQELPSRIARIV
jgi:DNA-binding transcriptional LysR family regulator